MNTPTHLLISAAVLARPGEQHRSRNGAILIGALLPDLSIFVMFFWSRILMGQPEELVWREIYFTPFWQGIGMVANSAPVYALIGLVAWWRHWPIVLALALSALLHLAFDFPLHHDDAHAHFWPLTTWRFESPLSYWDPDHFGLWVAGAELVLAIILIVVLWQRFPRRVRRAALMLAFFAYFAVPAYFIWQLGLP